MNGKGKKNLAEVEELVGEVMAGGAVGPTRQDPSRSTVWLAPFHPTFPLSVSGALHFPLAHQHKIPTCWL